jgi:putative glutamine amidotransferase
MRYPVVVVVTRRTTRRNKLIDYVGELHLELLIRLRILPLMVPVVDGTSACLRQYMEQMNGLLLVEGEDIEPMRYKAQKANFKYLEKTHPLKDEIEIRLLRYAMRHKLPVLGICRGIIVAFNQFVFGESHRLEARSQSTNPLMMVAIDC